jgi:Leu/Phe-tRNA-protein transferase
MYGSYTDEAILILTLSACQQDLEMAKAMEAYAKGLLPMRND